MTDYLSEIHSPRGRPLLIHKNYKFSLFLKDASGGDQWRCLNRKCPSYILTHGEKGKRFITHCEVHHIHDPGDIRKVRTTQRLSATARKIFPDVFQKSTKNSLNAYVGKFNGMLSEDLNRVRKTLAVSRRKKRMETRSKKHPIPSKNKVGVSDYDDDDLSVPTDTEYFEMDESSLTSDARSSSPELSNESQNIPSMISKKIQNEFDVAGWTYGNHLRSLGPKQRIIVENLVSDIIFKAKLNRLTIDTKIV